MDRSVAILAQAVTFRSLSTIVTMSRSRYEGTLADLVEALQPAVKSDGWLQYAEDHRSKINTKEIIRHASLIQKLATLQPNLSFKKTDIVGALMKISTNSALGLQSTEEQTEWAKTMDLRLRTMCRHVAQNKDRSSAGWLKKVFVPQVSPSGKDDEAVEENEGEGGEEEAAEEDEEEEAEEDEEASTEKPAKKRPAAEPEVTMRRPAAATVTVMKDATFYGWDVEFKKAWRARGTKAKEFTDDLFEQPGSKPTSPMWAKWADGDVHMISDLLVGTYHVSEAADSRGRKTTRQYIWEGEHCLTKKKIVVVRRNDRRPLTSIQYDGKQIMQVSSHQVGGDMATADSIGSKLAEQFAANLVTVDTVKETRDALLVEFGCVPGSSNPEPPKRRIRDSSADESVKKRPAAAVRKPAVAAAPQAPVQAPAAGTGATEDAALAFLLDGPRESLCEQFWTVCTARV